MRKIILASASPRRKEILEQIGMKFTIIKSTKEEIVSKELPWEMVEELSYQKAMDVVSQLPKMNIENIADELVVIGADTLVAYRNRVIGKPKDENDAYEILSLLQGKTHQVYTGVTLYVKKETEVKIITFYEKTDVVMYEMEENQVREYVETKEPMDKAGAYAIQGKCAVYIKEIHGDYNTVVGFPIARIMQELTRLEKEWK